MTKARKLADLGNVYDDGALSNRNLIINGAMQVAQRGTSFTAQTNEFAVDRFNYNQSSSATMDLEQSSDAPNGFLNSAKLTLNAVDSSIAATDYAQLVHKIEGQNMAHLNWGSSSAKTVTLSFWVKCSVAGDWPLRLINSGGTKSYAFYFTIDAANTWEYKTKTIEGPTDGTFLTTNGAGVELGVSFAVGSTYAGATADQWNTVSGYASSNVANNTGWIGTTDNTFQITGVQLEVGDTATPFEHEPYSVTLQKCQRYFNVFPKAAATGAGASAIPMWTGSSTSASTRVSVPGPVMRVRPTATLYGTSASSGTTPSIGSDGTYGIYTSSFHSAPTLSIGETTSDPSFRISANSTGFLAKGAAGMYFYSNLTRLGDSNWCGITLDAEL